MQDGDTYWKELYRVVATGVLVNKMKFMTPNQVPRAFVRLKEGEEDLEPALTRADVKSLIAKHGGRTEVKSNIKVGEAEKASKTKLLPMVTIDGVRYQQVKDT